MLEKINTDKTIKANFYSLVARMETLDKGMASEETYKIIYKIYTGIILACLGNWIEFMH